MNYTHIQYTIHLYILYIYICVFENLYDDHIGRVDLKTYDKMF